MSASRVPLLAHTDVSTLAWRAVSQVTSVASLLCGVPAATPDPSRVAIAYTSERWLRVGGERPPAFAPLSGFFATADGWVRTHGNYPHHARALTSALGLPPASCAEDVARALRGLRTADAVTPILLRGGLCVEVRREDPAVDAKLREHPAVSVTSLGPAPRAPRIEAPAHAPLTGVRVLDLTRVIAGPVATRTLALFGADVLRIDPPHLLELPWQHMDTGQGKRSALLDLAEPHGQAVRDELLSTADVVVLGYRAAGLDRLGLSPAALAQRRPGIIVLQLTAWGDRIHRGFDSLVQADSGIAWLESPDGVTPGALPAQALDHSAGYALAAAAMSLIARRVDEGGSWLAETSLRRIAADLLALPRQNLQPPQRHEATAAPLDPTGHVQEFEVDGMVVTTAAPAFRIPERFAAPRPWGRDRPSWSD